MITKLALTRPGSLVMVMNNGKSQTPEIKSELTFVLVAQVLCPFLLD